MYSRWQAAIPWYSLAYRWFVTDRHSGPGERLLYSKLQTDTLGYSVADRSLYNFSPTNIPVYALGDRPQCPGLLTDTPMYSVTYRSWFFSVADQYSGIRSMWQTTIIYPGLQTDTLVFVYFVTYSGIFITVNYQQTINLDPVTLSRT